MKDDLGLIGKLSPYAFRLSWIIGLAVLLLFLAGVGQASSTTAYIQVNSTEDVKNNDGQCTLREAIIAANADKSSGGKPGECAAGGDLDNIVLPPGTYILSRTDAGKEDASSTGDLDITSDVIIVGGPGVTIEGQETKDRIFHILGGNVSISDVTITGGSVSGDGGGIDNASELTLSNVTLSGNAASGQGGAIHNHNTGTLTLNNVTIADNNAAVSGGGIVNEGGYVNLENTIVVGNIAAGVPSDCTGNVFSQGHNLVGDGTGCLTLPSNSDIRVDPATVFSSVLGPLQTSVGGTQVHALLNGSPAIDAGDDNTCLPNDQRGEPRPMDGDRDGRYHCDIGAFEAGRDPLALIRAFPNVEGGITIQGLVSSAPNTEFALDFYASAVCDPSSPGYALDITPAPKVTTDENGYIYFYIDGPGVPLGEFITATTTDPEGNTSDFSKCVSVSPGNDSWPRAYSLDALFTPTATFEQLVDIPGQSRWFKFTVEPGSKVIVTLTNLPVNFDLTLYKDIRAAFEELSSPEDNDDLLLLGAEFAPDAFAPDAFAPDAFAPDAFAPDAFAPDAFAPDAFAPDAFAPDAFAPDAFAPDAFAPDAFAPDAFAPDAFAPDAFAPDAFASAQLRSLIGVSAFEGNSGEGLSVNTWLNTGEYYIRVRGRNGAFSLAAPFRLEVKRQLGLCGNIQPLPETSAMAPAGNPATLILTDESRMYLLQEGAPGAKAALQTLLGDLALAVDGVVVDVSQDPRVAFANSQADAHPECPYAKNLVALAIKDIIDGYRAQDGSKLEYAVIIGDDDIIPFFRHPDNALLANEQNYVPPVRDNTASQASLKLGYVLSQDAYGSQFDISLGNSSFPVPGLAVGRLVETADEINTMINAYLNSTTDGIIVPQSSLVTGYDFLADAALAIQDQFEAGIGTPADTLITDGDLPPTHPDAWTATELRTKLLNSRHDLIFLAGHFSANSALAADYSTRLLAQEVVPAAGVDLTNVILFSAGCHTGYNIVNQHGVPNVTREPDWAQAFARQGVTLIAGTGYQYGDTDFLKYSELLYLEFSKQLRAGTDPVSIGQALVDAKRAYLAQIPKIGGLDEKALLEATIFGLPMLKVDLPGRLNTPTDASIVSSLSHFVTDPGRTLGLSYADVTVTSPLNETIVQLQDINDGSSVFASYLAGNDGKIVTNPAEPTLPLEMRNVSVAGTVLRGVGFQGGSYTEQDVLPLIGAPTTEMRGVHTPFLSDIFYPVRPWSVNYFDALANGATRLMVTPAQHKTSASFSEPQTSTRRQFSAMSFRLYYNNNVDSFTGGSVPALAAPPDIVRVSAVPGNEEVTFRINIVGNPAVGIHEAWVTYTDISAPFPRTFQSVNLSQRATDSALWEGTLALNGTDPQHIRYIVQAVNGIGLVSIATNLGTLYTPGFDSEPSLPTQLTFQSPLSSGSYGTQVSFGARLTSGGTPLQGQRVIFRLGPQTRQALTDEDGVATATLSLLGLPGLQEVRVLFRGTADYLAALNTTPFTIEKQDTVLSLKTATASVFPNEDPGIMVTLTDVTGRRLGEKTVLFVVAGNGSAYSVAEITDYAGRASLGPVPLAHGSYDVNAFFNGTVDLDPTDPSPDNVVTLNDARYNASTTLGSLTLKNTPPVAVGDDYSVDEDNTLTVPAPGVLGNDSDANDDALTAVPESGPANGTLVLNGDGSFTYIPDADFNGSDSFTYRANDATDTSDIATVSINVYPVPDAPTAQDDSATTDEDTPLTIEVLANDTDVDGDSLTVSAVTQGTNGALSNNGTDVTYSPTQDYCGSDSFTYTVSDGIGATDSATVQVTVTCVNDAPSASDDAYSVDEDSTLTVPAPGVLVNDSDVEGDALTAILVDGPTNGTLSLNGDGSFIYSPDADLDGSDTFIYKVNDGSLDGNIASVTITANPINDAPTHLTLSNTNVGENEPVGTIVGVFLTADPDTGAVHTYSLVSGDGDDDNDSFTIEGDLLKTNTILDFETQDTYSIRAKTDDGNGGILEKSFIITVVNANDPPICTPATTSLEFIWSPDKQLWPVNILNVIDPDDPQSTITITILSIYQDEPVGKGNNSPDGEGIGTDTAWVRAERDGKGDGRVYHVQFQANDEAGGSCIAEVRTAVVSHDQGGDTDIDVNAIDGGPLFDSTASE